MTRRIPVLVAVLLPGVCSAQENVGRMEQVVQSYVSAKQFMCSVRVGRIS